MVTPLSEAQWRFFFAVAARVVPAVARLDAATQARFRDIVLKALADRPRAVQRQFGLFLHLIRWAPVLRDLARFERLRPERQDAVLRWLLDAPLSTLRSGFWGLRAQVFMGYYARPEVWAEIRYAPSFHGNELLHG
jgi:hypothetical protein